MKKINNKVLNSILGSTFFKLVSGVISFITVPFLLKALGTSEYAIWVTMTALLAWLNLFDFGSGYSLKNKITEATANKEIFKVQSLVAGTIQFYVLMTILIFFAFLISLLFVSIFKAHIFLSFAIYIPVILSFPFTLGHFIIQGLKKFNIFNFFLLTQSICWLVIVYAFQHRFFTINIYKLAGCYSGLFVITNFTIMLTSLRSINFKFSSLLSLKNFRTSKSSLMVGTKFFVLQVTTVFMYSLGNILTYNNLKLINVAQFDTVNKVYTMGMTIFSVVISVFWTEISHEKALGNKIKLLKLFRQLLLISTLFSLGSLIITLAIPALIEHWTRNIIHVSIKQIYPFCCLVTIQAFAYSGAVFLNAFEELKGQIVLSFISAALMIPLSNALFNINFGIGTVPLSSAILTLPTMVYVIYKAKDCVSRIT